MARKLRLQYPGAIYHVMNRGDYSEVIFREDRDRDLLLATLAEACAKTAWQVHALCLMSNHFHFVLETLRANLAQGMKWLLGTWELLLQMTTLGQSKFGGPEWHESSQSIWPKLVSNMAVALHTTVTRLLVKCRKQELENLFMRLLLMENVCAAFIQDTQCDTSTKRAFGVFALLIPDNNSKVAEKRSGKRFGLPRQLTGPMIPHFSKTF